MGMLLIPFFDTLALIIDLYFKVVVVEVILFWLIHFKILTITNAYAQKFMDILKMLTEPVYKKIRAKIPPFADFDVSPFILLLALFFVARLIYVLREMVL